MEKIRLGDTVTTDGGHTGIVVDIDHNPQLENPFWYTVECDGVLYCTFDVQPLKTRKKQSLATLIGITHNL